MATGAKEARAFGGQISKRDDPLSCGKDRVDRRGRSLDRSEGHGLPKPGGSGEQSSGQDRTALSSRARDAGHGTRRHTGRSAETEPRPPHAEVQGSRGVLPRRRVVDRSPSGDHPAGGGVPDARGRAPHGDTRRVAGDQAEREPCQVAEGQIGVGQRARPYGGEARESKSRGPSIRERKKTGLESNPKERRPSGSVRREEGRRFAQRGPPLDLSSSGSRRRRERELARVWKRERRERKPSRPRSEGTTRKKSRKEKAMDAEAEGSSKREETRREVRYRSPPRRRPDDDEISIPEVNKVASSFLRTWLADKPPTGLSSAQLVKHLTLQLMATEGSLKEYFL